ncbi:hypothetical protein PF005_g7952 [Phytophthora fragariae]|uniref:Uncharacterized protein n=1 Tax=Phytophthora fragariae TaxID=53985 RepID=A0A6A3SND5_9STRA|nr:hypothetical protein PF003_g33275 [Phytophthora fragariae]KAE8941516.1 hypothetical protein PF009_g8697 [Phytophthora fragariae]KAE9016971.1 hypothetical protein PF011_g6887 [Phytophthora fragariae]KAE9120262.1 hypothetical protein PF007_g8223 [Phytophthora fragariae]KAE9121362.1 hypothetical protein PF010_g7149 [Phytophthora fragariae]
MDESLSSVDQFLRDNGFSLSGLVPQELVYTRQALVHLGRIQHCPHWKIGFFAVPYHLRLVTQLGVTAPRQH